MNAKDYLEGIRTLTGDLERTLNRIQRVEDQLAVKGISYENGRARSTTGDPLSSGVVELIGYHETLDALLEGYIEAEAEAVYVIETLSTHVMRRAASLYYLDNKKVGVVAGLLGCAPSTVKNALARARDELNRNGKLARAMAEYRDNSSKPRKRVPMSTEKYHES